MKGIGFQYKSHSTKVIRPAPNFRHPTRRVLSSKHSEKQPYKNAKSNLDSQAMKQRKISHIFQKARAKYCYLRSWGHTRRSQRTVYDNSCHAVVYIFVCPTAHRKATASPLQFSKPNTNTCPSLAALLATALDTIVRAPNASGRLLGSIQINSNSPVPPHTPQGVKPQ